MRDLCHWRQAEEALAREGTLTIETAEGHQRVNPLVRISSQAINDMLRFGAQFGLTPSGRLRLSGIKPPPTPSKFDGLLGWRCATRTSMLAFMFGIIKTMGGLLIHGLQDIYYAEQQILKSLPKMIDKATNRDLVAGLRSHLEETNKQVERLEKAFAKLGKQPSGTTRPAIDGIIKEFDETAGEIEDKAMLDAAIVANAQAVEHYEMCR